MISLLHCFCTRFALACGCTLAGGRSAGDEMAHATSGVAVVVATLVVAFAADLVSAQTCTESDNFPACHTYLYLQSPIMLTPDPYCCSKLSFVQTTWGAPCYCELLATVNPNLINMTKACALPRDCNVEADMSKCSCGGTSSTATPIPGISTPPPSAGPRTPPAGLFTYTPCCWFTNASWFRYNATRVYNADCPKLWNSDSCEWFFRFSVPLEC